ncbi:MAG: archaetidylserine decarboxylase [Casimicrobiaceae bacterium]|nr:archaetidylserine decarboxylase [Casimicrobiaceae bacterium]
MNLFLQRLLPRRMLTEFAGRLASARAGALTTWAIRRFIAHYGVNMQEAAEPDPAAYASFNDFFTRALKPEARPLCPAVEAPWLCPVDGTVSALGSLLGEQGEALVQAKGHTYTLAQLLAGDDSMVESFRGGHFVTLYLSPRDYHRVHMPIAGTLTRMVYVPGELYAVKPATVAARPRLFARNERIVCAFDTLYGPLALILVGAMIVGSMATVWHGLISPPHAQALHEWRYPPGQVELARGAELGRFLLGSTVIVLWPRCLAEQRFRLNPAWQPGSRVRMGEAMAHLH